MQQFSYRVSHIKLDRVNESKLRFEEQIRKFKKIIILKNLRLIDFLLLQKMLDFSSIMCVFWRL